MGSLMLGRTVAPDLRLETVEPLRHDGAATVQVQFGNILTGRAGRARKTQDQRLVEPAAFRLENGNPCLPRVRKAAGEPLQRAVGAGPADSNDGDRGRRGAR